jgi:dsRNA-specific ribonuclease
MDKTDETILDNKTTCDHSNSSEHKNVKKKPNTQNNKSQNQNGHHHFFHKNAKKSNNKDPISKEQSTLQKPNSNSKNKKTKRLPWNTEILKDRFTPQIYQVQLIDNFFSVMASQNGDQTKNVIFFMKSEECKNYLKITCIKQHAIKLNQLKSKKIMLLITNMGSDISKYVELLSRHTTLKLAGIDSNLINFDLNALKKDAQILIMNINTLLEWFKRDFISLDEIYLLLFDDVSAAFHNTSYKLLMEKYVIDISHINTIGFSSLDIDKSTTHKQIEQHIDYLKHLFRCPQVETATDLLDTHNILNGFEPKECIQICDNANLSQNDFKLKLINKIKDTYQFLDDLNSLTNSNNNENYTYTHLLCIRVVNECVYLLNEVGIWCLAKSLLPLICQIDKLALYVHNANKKQFINEPDLYENQSNATLSNLDIQQELILCHTSTLLRLIREMCIKQFLLSKQQSSSFQVDSFLNNFSTPKVKSLIRLLRKYKCDQDEFCCLIFVQNKQVATSLSLLLKKIAKEDSELDFVYPNYVIGSTHKSSSNSNNLNNDKSSCNSNENNTENTPSQNDNLKQEEIIRKFYSGEINLLICTYEMEESINVPSCVNLIIRFNCNVNAAVASNDTLPFDYFQYIRTKTRTKRKNASCFFFIEQNYFDSFFRQYVKFKQIETTLIKNYSILIKENDKISQSKNTIDDSTPIDSLTLDNSIYLLNRYCLRLPSDALTSLTPRFQIYKDGSRYKCLIYLPINSGMRDPIESEWHDSLAEAKLNAAYKTCLILFTKNELNDQMEPITKEMFYKINHKYDADDEQEWSQFSNAKINSNALNQQLSTYMSHRPGGNKRKQIYHKKISPYLKSFQSITTQTQSYLYIIKLELTTSLNKDENEENFKKDKRNFGFLASKLMLEVVDFPIFTQNGEETVQISLIKSGIFLTPNQLKLIKSFHRFIFSNVLRMDGRGAAASPSLLNVKINNQQNDAAGCFICILNEMNEFDWDLMKQVEGCTDRTFMRIPNYVRRVQIEMEDEEENKENSDKNNEQEMFQFDKEKYMDAVVIPYYRANDLQPQFYCVQSIDFTSSPLSPFPTSSHSSASNYGTFYEYFALKYSILITNLAQPLLVVSHPSTRLNLLTPRYMNMKASVLQKSYTHHNKNNDKKPSSNRIFLVPELVNLHRLSATCWRRSLCLPSILYRFNSLLSVEELRREIAQSTGVGVPWVNPNEKFPKLTFIWDQNKEIEMSDVPDYEVDLQAIEQKHELEKISNKNNHQTPNAINSNNNDYSDWNFEISTWDETCMNETKQTNNKKNLLDEKNAKKIFENVTMCSYPTTNSSSNSETVSGWLDENFLSNNKTLFIDPNDMDLFGEDLIDEMDQEENEYFDNQINKKENKTNVIYNHESDNDETESDEEQELVSTDIKNKFTIDMTNLKADMKKKSAKLLSKLSVNSSSCNLVKNLVKTSEISNQVSTYINLINQELNILNNCDQMVKFDTYINESNDWLSNIEFFLDLNDSNSNLTKLIENLKSNKIEINNKENTIANFESKMIKLPAGKEDIEKILSIEFELKTRSVLDNNQNVIGKNKKLDFSSSGIQQSLRNTDWSFNFSLDDSNKLDPSSQLGPGPAVLLQALTLSNAADGFDLERLETVGDSFLKQAVSVYLFFMYPNVHEGKLSYLRSKQVSNYNLYKLGKRRGLHELIISTKFEPLDSWLPPHYDSISNNSSTSASASLLLSSLFASPSNKSKNSKIIKNTTCSLSISTNQPEHLQKLSNCQNNLSQLNSFDKYKDHVVSDKSIADSVEAIIGAYLITSGPQAALQVMSWFGLEVLPKAKCEDGSEVLVNIPEVPPPKINDPVKLEQLLDGYSNFEACIGYKFKQPAYLLQAFTHSSYTDNTVTDCYQRLEFLGDAILDYVITRYLYEDKKHIHSPGELTDLRSALVNNNIFAYLAVKYEFYKYFKYFSPDLFPIIDNFVQNQKNRNDEFDLEEDFFDYPIDDEDEEEDVDEPAIDDYDDNKNGDLDGSNNHNSFNSNAHFQLQTNELEETEVPKCLGDIFESVAGAIFLDSDKSFDTVWKVYYGLMKPHIDKFTSQVPKSPIRELFELEPETAKFEKPERTIDGKIRVTVSVFGRGKFKGVGRNYRIAKNAAAKLALKFLKSNKSQ